MINERLFGSPIPNSVQRQLDERQSRGNIGAEIPFIRMWVAPKFVATEELIETIETTHSKITFEKTDAQKELELLRQTPIKGQSTYVEPPPNHIKITKNQIEYLTDADLEQYKIKIPPESGTSINEEALENILNLKIEPRPLRPPGQPYDDDYGQADRYNSDPNVNDYVQSTEELDLTEYPSVTTYNEIPINPAPDSTSESEEEVPKDFEALLNEKHTLSGYKETFHTFVDTHIKREEVPYSQAVYVIGDYGYQTGYKSYNPNKPISDLNSPGESVIEKDYSDSPIAEAVTSREVLDSRQNSLSKAQVSEIEQNLFPNELQNNQLLKPGAGITSITSETEGTLGIIKKTTVNFVVHNFSDFDRIYNKYFLKPGSTIFVDFGWSNSELYDPNELIKHEKGVEHFLYNETIKDDDKEYQGVITRNQGKLETLCGIVTDYSAKVTPNGSVECSVTLTSQNSALLSFKNDNNNEEKVKVQLTTGIYEFGLKPLINSLSNDRLKSNLLNYLNRDTPIDFSTNRGENYRENLKYLFALNYGLNSDEIPNVSIEQGFFLPNLEAENGDSYISWGRFEDLIINSNYGFGDGDDDIQKGKNFNVRMDSSLSFTHWSKQFTKIQKVKLQGDKSPDFLFPGWWGNSNPDGGNGSYSWKKGKYPTGYKGDSESDKGDREFGKIPIREVFINMSLVINAFTEEKNKSILQVVNAVLKSINEGSDGLFDWKLKLGSTDSKVEVVDKNYAFNKELNDKLTALIEDPKSNPFYTFNIMSKKSIVKDYNLEFKIPSGRIGDMYAIRALGVENSIHTTEQEVTKLVGTDIVDRFAPKILNWPDMGGYRGEQTITDTKNKFSLNIFDNAHLYDNSELKTLASTDAEKPKEQSVLLKNKAGKDISDILQSNPQVLMDSDFFSDEVNTGTNEENADNNKTTATVKENDVLMESNGLRVYSSLLEYETSVLSDGLKIEVPLLLPYTLSLTIHGIASVQPGDVFRVDYLPQMYLEKTYLQVMKVSHTIDSSGWFTTFDTQFREIFPQAKNDIFTLLTNEEGAKFLSANALSVGGKDRFNFKTYDDFDIGKDLGKQNPIRNQYMVSNEDVDSAIKIEVLIKYIIKLKPLNTAKGELSHVFEFEFTKKGQDYFHGPPDEGGTDNDFPGLCFNTMRVNTNETGDMTKFKNNTYFKYLKEFQAGLLVGSRVFQSGDYDNNIAIRKNKNFPTVIQVDYLAEAHSIHMSSKYYKETDGEGTGKASFGRKYVSILPPPFAVIATKYSGSPIKYHMWVRNKSEYAIVPAPDNDTVHKGWNNQKYEELKSVFENGDTLKLDGDYDYKDTLFQKTQ